MVAIKLCLKSFSLIIFLKNESFLFAAWMSAWNQALKVEETKLVETRYSSIFQYNYRLHYFNYFEIFSKYRRWADTVILRIKCGSYRGHLGCVSKCLTTITKKYKNIFFSIKVLLRAINNDSIQSSLVKYTHTLKAIKIDKWWVLFSNLVYN